MGKDNNIIDFEIKRIEKKIKNTLKTTGLKNALHYPIKIPLNIKELNLLWESAKRAISIWKETMLLYEENEDDGLVDLQNLLHLIEESIQKQDVNTTNLFLDIRIKDIDDLVAILEIGGGVHAIDEESCFYSGWTKKDARLLFKLYERVHGIWEIVDEIIQEN